MKYQESLFTLWEQRRTAQEMFRGYQQKLTAILKGFSKYIADEKDIGLERTCEMFW